MRIYQLYPAGGRFSNKSIDYTGVAYYVLASSIKQAYYLAYHNEWSGGICAPGIVDVYTRGGTVVNEGWHQLWDGCRIHGTFVSHGDRSTKVSNMMQEHFAKEHGRE